MAPPLTPPYGREVVSWGRPNDFIVVEGTSPPRLRPAFSSPYPVAQDSVTREADGSHQGTIQTQGYDQRLPQLKELFAGKDDDANASLDKMEDHPQERENETHHYASTGPHQGSSSKIQAQDYGGTPCLGELGNAIYDGANMPPNNSQKIEAMLSSYKIGKKEIYKSLDILKFLSEKPNTRCFAREIVDKVGSKRFSIGCYAEKINKRLKGMESPFRITTYDANNHDRRLYEEKFQQVGGHVSLKMYVFEEI